MKHLLSIKYFGPGREEARRQIIEVVVEALKMVPYYAKRISPEPRLGMESHPGRRPKMVPIFTEASTRTLYSFITAGELVDFSIAFPTTAEASSLAKNESAMDTLRMLNQYLADVVVIRSRTEGLGLHLAQCLEETASEGMWVHPYLSIVIGGAGTRDHPSQVLLDIVTIVARKLGVRQNNEQDLKIIEEIFSRPGGELNLRQQIAEILDNLTIAFVGGLKESRVTHDWVHLGEWFNIKFIFIAPPFFQVERWCFFGINAATGDNLHDALGADYVYTIRLQTERLPKTISEREARLMVEDFQITEWFLDQCQGEILDALPIDEKTPTIPVNVRRHPKVIAYMQSAMGVPTRMAILRLCYEGRTERMSPLKIPPLGLTAENVLKEQTLADHQRELAAKYHGREDLVVYGVGNGTVIDRLRPGTINIIDAINRKAGLYARGKKGERVGQILLCREFDSQAMGEKEVLYLYDRWPDPQLAAIYSLVSPEVRVSFMSRDDEAQGRPGYRRLSFPLPKAVADIFTCLNESCVTRTSSEADTFFWVHGRKGEEVVLECAYCQRHYPVKEVIAATFFLPTV